MIAFQIVDINFQLPGPNGPVGRLVPGHAIITSNKQDQEIAFSMVKATLLTWMLISVVMMFLVKKTLENVTLRFVVSFKTPF